MKLKKIRLLGLLAFGVLFSASTALGSGAPLVTSFTASPQSVNYGYSTLLSWNIIGGTGHDLLFVCPIGVTVKTASGSIFPCNTRQSISSNASDSGTFYINNITGNTITLPVKLFPKDSSGADYDGGVSTLSLSVGSVPHPITDFSYATSSSTNATAPVSLSWTGVEIGGTNMQFDCQSGVQIFSTNPAVTSPIPCAQPAYQTDLAQSGTVNVYFANSNAYAVDESVRILPAISPGVYDATHAQTVTITIPPHPAKYISSISTFAGSQMSVLSGQSVSFTWDTNNTAGVNFEMPCNNSVVLSSVVGGATTTLPCGVPAFKTVLPTTGTTTIFFTNKGISAQSADISLLLQNADGTYDGTKSLELTISVFEPGRIVAPTDATPIASITPVAPVTPTVAAEVTPTVSTESVAAATTTPATGSILAAHPVTFNTFLHLGSRGAQVSALQSFFKQDSSLYPEGLVTGYFGPLTLSIVERFQERYNIAKPGDDGYGLVGPLTRAKLNSMQSF